MTYNTFGGTIGAEGEEYQEYLNQTTVSINDNMMAYCNHEHNAFQSYPSNHFSPFAAQDHGHARTFPSDVAFPFQSQQFSRFALPDYPRSLVSSQYCPPNRPYMQDFQAEPQMMISRGVNYVMSQHIPRSVDYQFPAPPTYSPDLGSPLTSSPSLSFMSSPEQYYPPPSWPRNILSPALEEREASVQDASEEKESPYDKPYAQLIYDALMQAPGHRMLLKDIYEWFIHNSIKPRESGTNGWQNSIRHNLSMNQAFENDKNDPIANRGSRKANSVWVLTEEAIKNGVQSTTRFRKNNKNNMSKKNGGNKAHAIQRQRSGARGGRAAKRSAQLKRTEARLGKAESEQEQEQEQEQAELPAGRAFSFSEHGVAIYADEWCSYEVGSPATPEEDGLLTPPYNLLPGSHFGVGPEVEIKHEAQRFLDEDDRLRIILSQTDSGEAVGDGLRY